ncbi:MAG: oligosaccharide flippase family protein [Planctomycetota bacterium]
MSVLKRNIAANFGGSVWTGLMGLVFVPLYIHFMGIEAYGLIGIFAALVASLGLLDMGLSNTVNREMARLAVQPDRSQEMRDLVRTLEIPYWLVGLLIAVVVVCASPLIAYHWVKVEKLTPHSVQTGIMIMGLALAFQWPIAFYSGGLMGLQRQVLLNSINAVMATFRGLGAVLVIWLVSPTVEAFFSWQIIVSAVHIGLVVFYLRRSLPHAAGSQRFRRELLVKIWRFAAGVTGITVLATILMQLDKVILSRMLSLEMFGYYTLAYVIAMTLTRFVVPVFSAAYPRLTNLVALGATVEIKELYHKSAQLVSVLVLPVALVVAFYSKEILLLWTQDPAAAGHTHVLVSILVIGTALNGLMHIPYALQLAHGWTRLTFLVNLVSVLVLAPLMIILARSYGAVGAASVWVILNAGYVAAAVPIMHRRLLPAEKWHWYLVDVGLPLGVAVITAGALHWAIPLPANNIPLCVCICMVSAITMGATVLATPVTRDWIRIKIAAGGGYRAN